MAYDAGLAHRIHDLLEGRDVVDKRMFGGLAFMRDGRMFCAIIGDELMLRVGPEAYQRTLTETHVRPMDFTGRPMTGFVVVGAAGIDRDEVLQRRLEQGLAFVASMAPPRPKARSTRRATERPTNDPFEPPVHGSSGSVVWGPPESTATARRSSKKA
ncbi:MAG: hypothetical protein RL199_2186 [Pseudomonadota bacterium]|jgi:TfoX/Sxy family transcriptional regulator of competence genes